MYIYIYDSFLKEKKYETILDKIEARLTHLGLNGKTIRVNNVKNIKESIDYEIKYGASTIVAVGGDSIFFNAINILAKTPIPLGFIPVEKSIFSQILGINEDSACDILSLRKIEKMDLGKINNNIFFLSYLSIFGENTAINVQNKYIITTNNIREIFICNAGTPEKNNLNNHLINPQDGLLDVFINTYYKKRKIFLSSTSYKSYFKLSQFSIINEEGFLLLDGGVKKINTPAEISICPASINLIVKKNLI